MLVALYDGQDTIHIKWALSQEKLWKMPYSIKNLFRAFEIAVSFLAIAE
jgi:hypothetical protein